MGLPNKGHIPWNKGKPHTEKTKEKLREKAKIQWEIAKMNNIPIGMVGRHHSEETKAKLVQSHIGKHPTKEQNIKNSNKHKGELNHFYGKFHSEESLLKMSKAHSGGHLTEEHKAKISKANKGKRRTEEQRLQLSQSKIGIYHSEETKTKLSQITKLQRIRTKGQPNSIDRTGQYPNEETRRKMGIKSSAKWQDPNFRDKWSGENAPQWLGGKSFEPYTKEFNRQLKSLIRIRDGYICQLCGMSESENLRNLECHHIDYNKVNTMPNNLIALCHSCHTRTNSNREYWADYFRNLLNQRQINPKALRGKREILDLVGNL